MTKTRLVFISAIAMIAAASCTKEITQETSQENQEIKLYPMTFSAGADDGIDPVTKVALGGADFKTVNWQTGDKIKIFDGTGAALPEFTLSAGADTQNGTFTGSVADPNAKVYYAIYPYQAGATYNATELTGKDASGVTVDKTKGGHIIMTLPAEQQAVDNSVDPNAFISLAKTDAAGTLNFHNLGGLIKFQLDAADVPNLESVSLSGNALESISGDIKIGFAPTGEGIHQEYVSGKMHDYVTLKKPVSGFKAGTDYYFTIRTCNFSKGFTITAKYSDGSIKHITTNKKPISTVSRNCILNLKVVPALTVGMPNDLYIAYTHGYDINAAGMIINKAKYPTAKVIKKASGLNDVDEGLHFINPINADNTPIEALFYSGKQTIAIGRFSDKKSTLKLKAGANQVNLPASTAEDYFILKNIKLDLTAGTKTYLMYHNTNGQVLENIIFDGCKIEIPAGKQFLINVEAGRHLQNITFNKCDIKINGNGTKIINDKNAAANPATYNLTFTDNIVYSEAQPTTGTINGNTEFSIFKSQVGITLDKLIVTNNTFVHLYCNRDGFVYTGKNTNYTLENNIFYIPSYDSVAVVTQTDGTIKKQWWGFLHCDALKNDLAGYPAEGAAKSNNNYCYQNPRGNNFKPTYVDLKKTVGTAKEWYTGVTMLTNYTVDPFQTMDFATPKFTLKASHEKYQGARR